MLLTSSFTNAAYTKYSELWILHGLFGHINSLFLYKPYALIYYFIIMSLIVRIKTSREIEESCIKLVGYTGII